MDVDDLADLNEEAAQRLVTRLLAQFEATRQETERLRRRAIGIHKMIEGVVEMFPAAEDLLPEDFDDDAEPRPRGAQAVERVLGEHPGSRFAVSNVVELLRERGWMPNSTNPSNAVRTALERLVEAGIIEKTRLAEGGPVMYGYPKPKPAYDYGEEPF